MTHLLAKTLLISQVTELIAKYHHLPLSEARDNLYSSDIVNLIEDDETGLYGESALFIFSLYEDRLKK